MKNVWEISLELKRDTEDGRLITFVYTDCFRSLLRVTLRNSIPPVKLANHTFSEFGSENLSATPLCSKKQARLLTAKFVKWVRERTAPLLKSELNPVAKLHATKKLPKTRTSGGST